MDSSDPGAAAFVEVIHRMTGIRARLIVAGPADVKRLRRDLAAILAEERGGMDFTHFLSLGVALSRCERGLTMREISRVLGVPQSTATRVVDGMVSRRHVRRASDPADRRVVRITYTPSGLKIFQAANALLRRRAERVLDAFSPAERGQLLGYMHRLADALEQEATLAEQGGDQ